MSKHSFRASAVAVGALLGIAAIAVGSSAVLVAHGAGTKPHIASAHAAANVTRPDNTSGSAVSTGGASTNQQAGSAFLGVSVAESSGALQVAAVVPGGPADSAGIKQGDTISSVDGTAVATTADLKKALAAKKPGDSVSLSVNRAGAAQTITVTLGAAPQGRGSGGNAGSAGSAGSATTGRGFLGISVQNVDDAAKQKYNLTSTDGALIAQVQSGGPADTAGLKAGDVITSVNNQPVKTIDDLTGILSAMKSGDSAAVQYSRAGASQNATITLGAGPAANGNLPRFGGNGGNNANGAGGGNSGNGNSNTPGENGEDGGGGGIPGVSGIGSALGQNFDRFISSDVKTKDASGSIHTDTTVGGVVKGSPTASQVTVTLNGGGDKTFTIDNNTKVHKGRSGSQANALAQDDKVLVTTRDGSDTATSILVVNLNGGPGSFLGNGGSGNGTANGKTPKNGGAPANGSTPGNSNAGGSQNDPQGGQIHIRVPGGQNITVPGAGGSNRQSPGKSSGPTF